MNEVTNKNFKQLFPKIKQALENATFVAIDLEFTGLPTGKTDIFFDEVETRYQSLRTSIHNYTIIQFGLTTFHYVPEYDKYEAASYSFYLLPRTTPSTNRQVSWQVSTLEFLAAHKFDFNKFVYDGISYLNTKDQALLLQQIKDNEFLATLETQLSYEDGCSIKDSINRIQDWLTKNKSSTMLLTTTSPYLKYVLHKDIRSRFPNIWTINGEKSVTAMKVSPSLRTVLQNEEKEFLEQDLLDSYIGFSKVVKLLQDLNKPLIGHNLFFDLMFIYQQFYEPLPDKYRDFKRKIHSLFPNIYDTRYISLKLLDDLDIDERWKGSSLLELYKHFKIGPGSILVKHAPNVYISGQKEFDETMHHAGWDSYISAYLFSRFLCLDDTKQKERAVETNYSVTSLQVMKRLGKFANYTITPRCMTKYINLAGNDAKNNHPVIHVKTRGHPITVKKIVNEFSHFGSVDMLYCTKQEAVLTVASTQRAQKIMQHFESNQQMCVTPYRRFFSRIPFWKIRYMRMVPFGQRQPWLLFNKFWYKLAGRF